jgi:hypothetical protein
VRRSMPRASRGVQKHGARPRVWTFNETSADLHGDSSVLMISPPADQEMGVT